MVSRNWAMPTPVPLPIVPALPIRAATPLAPLPFWRPWWLLLIPADGLYTLTSLTGYSGGGKKMIAEYENLHDPELDAPRLYG